MKKIILILPMMALYPSLSGMNSITNLPVKDVLQTSGTPKAIQKIEKENTPPSSTASTPELIPLGAPKESVPSLSLDETDTKKMHNDATSNTMHDVNDEAPDSEMLDVENATLYKKYLTMSLLRDRQRAQKRLTALDHEFKTHIAIMHSPEFLQQMNAFTQASVANNAEPKTFTFDEFFGDKMKELKRRNNEISQEIQSLGEQLVKLAAEGIRLTQAEIDSVVPKPKQFSSSKAQRIAELQQSVSDLNLDIKLLLHKHKVTKNDQRLLQRLKQLENTTKHSLACLQENCSGCSQCCLVNLKAFDDSKR